MNIDVITIDKIYRLDGSATGTIANSHLFKGGIWNSRLLNQFASKIYFGISTAKIIGRKKATQKKGRFFISEDPNVSASTG